MTEWGIRRVASPGAELKRWRTQRKLSLRALGDLAKLDFGHLGKVERGTAKLTLDVAEVCDQILDAGGALIHAYYAAQGSVRPAQLPAVPQFLVGRDAELAVLLDGTRHRLPGTPSVVAIDGPAGVGKTALALRLAHQIAEEHVDGQLYADLGAFAPPGRSVTVERVLEGFLRSMGASSIPDTTAERAALYRSLLAQRRVLIVLDNVADLDDIAPLIPASAGCTVVVTSRRALSSLVTRLTATRVTLRPLAEPDSISVVRHVIGEERAAVDADALVTLTRLCGHLPLALGVAADQIALYPDRRVVDLVDELIDEDHRLSVGEGTDLRAVFSWSYRDLDTEAARLFRLLGLHRGPHLSIPAAAALAGLTRAQTRRYLHRLAALHLVDINTQPDTQPDSHPVIRLHTLIRAYARDLVVRDENEHERHAAIQRLVAWYAATVRAASLQLTPHVLTPLAPTWHLDGDIDGVEPLIFSEEFDAWSWCTSERDNVGAITTLALQHGSSAAAHHLVTGLADLGLIDHPFGQPTPHEQEGTSLGMSCLPGKVHPSGARPRRRRPASESRQ